MKRLARYLIVMMCLLTAALPVFGQASTIVPEDATFAISIKPSALYQSQLGQRILNVIRQEEPNIDQTIDELCTTVGIDLRNALGETVIFGTEYYPKDIALVADIGDTAGNINGLLLAAPGYDSTVYKEKLIIHSLPTEGPHGQESERIYCAMPKRPGNDAYLIVASFDPTRVQQMVDQVFDEKAELTPEALKSDLLIEAWFTGLPELAQMAEADGPPSVWARMIERAHLTLGETNDGMTGELKLTMENDLRAQQVAGLIRGGMAMVQLVATSEPEAQPLADIAQLVQIDHNPGDMLVSAKFKCSFTQFDRAVAQLKEWEDDDGWDDDDDWDDDEEDWDDDDEWDDDEDEDEEEDEYDDE